MLRLLPIPFFICIYLFSYWRCKKNIAASDKQLKPCIDWAYVKNLPLPKKPSFVEFYIVYLSSFEGRFGTSFYRSIDQLF